MSEQAPQSALLSKLPEQRAGKLVAYARELVRFLRNHIELEGRVMKAAEIPGTKR